jgi:uncharacterized membrane protein YqjE
MDSYPVSWQAEVRRSLRAIRLRSLGVVLPCVVLVALGALLSSAIRDENAVAVAGVSLAVVAGLAAVHCMIVTVQKQAVLYISHAWQHYSRRVSMKQGGVDVVHIHNARH